MKRNTAKTHESGNMAEMKEIFLRDEETNDVYSIVVTPDEAKRLQTDIIFANQKLYEAKHAKYDGDITDELHDITETSHSDHTEVEEVGAFKWPHEAILLLIEEYNLRQQDFTSGKISQKKIWSVIADKMKKHGHNVSGLQCLSKFSGLKRTYKAIKDNNSKSGSGTRTWRYFSNMDELLNSKPCILPLTTVSSSGKKTKLVSDCSTSSVDNCLEDEKIGINSIADELHDITETSHSDHTEEVGVFKWPHEAILLLIEEYNLRQQDFTSGKMSQKKIWLLIANEMKKHGHNVTGLQCLSKFSGLKRTYKAIKDNNNRSGSGSGSRTWPYFSNMDELLHSKLYTLPLTTVSSSGRRTKHSDCSASSVDSLEDEKAMHIHKKSRQMSSMERLIEDFKEDRKIAEEAMERRHKENVELRQQLLHSFERMIQILEKK